MSTDRLNLLEKDGRGNENKEEKEEEEWKGRPGMLGELVA